MSEKSSEEHSLLHKKVPFFLGPGIQVVFPNGSCLPQQESVPSYSETVLGTQQIAWGTDVGSPTLRTQYVEVSPRDPV